jgi:hypothetical protein
MDFHKDIKLRLDNVNIEDVSLGFEKENYDDLKDTNLRDIAIVLYCCCGHGVTWNLAHEISKRMNISYDEIALALDDIFCEYADMPDEDDDMKFIDCPKPSEQYFDDSSAESYARYKLKKNIEP